MNSLRIYFTSHWRDSTSPCEWALCDETGALLQSGNDPLATLPKGHECIGILAPDRVLSVSGTLPPGSKRRWQAALPFIAEEHTWSEPENNHVVPGTKMQDGRTPLAVVDKAWLSRIIEACRNAKLNMRRVIPETFMPPLAAESWVLVWDGRSGFLRTDTASGMVLDGNSQNNDTIAPTALQLYLRSTPLPQKIIVRPFSTTEHSPSSAPQQLPAWQNLPVPLVLGETWDWRRAAIPAQDINMLWGDLAPSIRIKEWWPNLRPVALILLVLFVIETVGTHIEWALLTQERAMLTQNMQRSFRSAFGEGSTLVNAPLQMQRNLAELRHAAGLPDEGDFLSLLNVAARRLNALPVGSVRTLHYEAGRLDVDIKLTNSADIKKLQQALQQSGLSVRMGEIKNAGDGMQARLSLMAGGVMTGGVILNEKIVLGKVTTENIAGQIISGNKP